MNVNSIIGLSSEFDVCLKVLHFGDLAGELPLATFTASIASMTLSAADSSSVGVTLTLPENIIRSPGPKLKRDLYN